MVVEYYLGSLTLCAASHLMGKLMDKSLEGPQIKKVAYELIEYTLKRFIEDKKARQSLKGDISLLDYRLGQSVYRLYDDLITAIVKTGGLVDDEITDDLRKLSAIFADIFNKVSFDVSGVSTATEARTFGSQFHNFQEYINAIETENIIPILEKIEKVKD